MHSVPNTLIETKSAIYSYPRHFYMAVTPWILNGFLYALEACLVNLELRLLLSALNFSSRNKAFQKPSKINKIEARNRKKRGGEKSKTKRVKTDESLLNPRYCFLRMPELLKLIFCITYLDQKYLAFYSQTCSDHWEKARLASNRVLRRNSQERRDGLTSQTINPFNTKTGSRKLERIYAQLV